MALDSFQEESTPDHPQEEGRAEPPEVKKASDDRKAQPSRDLGDIPVRPDKTILVVEDDLDTADSLKVKLEANGYNVLAIYDGLQALETARKLNPALIILDVMVPGLTGYHVCRLLKFDERYRNIPIIILTGKVDKNSREISTKAGADLYMTKPFELDDVLEEVKKFVG